MGLFRTLFSIFGVIGALFGSSSRPTIGDYDDDGNDSWFSEHHDDSDGNGWDGGDGGDGE